MRPYRHLKWYRSRRGLIFGVCQGLADWKELSVGMLRLILIIVFLFTGGIFVVIAYLALALALPIEPSPESEDPEWKKRFFDQ